MEKVYWNPWHGCRKISEGCQNCYMFEQDASYGVSSKPRVVKTKFDLPIAHKRDGSFKLPGGTIVPTCFTSDFFLEDADSWRDSAWDVIRHRPDLTFFIITKRVHRIYECLPNDWGNGWDNVIINVTAENQRRADERIPILLDLPIKVRGVAVAPILESVDLQKYLATGKINFVSVGGESGSKARPCNFDWMQSLYTQCKLFGVEFNIHQTGTNFIKDNRCYRLSHDVEYTQAAKALELLRNS